MFIDIYYFYYVNCGCNELLILVTIWEDAEHGCVYSDDGDEAMNQ